LSNVFAIHPYINNDISYLDEMNIAGYFHYEPVLFNNEIYLLSGGEHNWPVQIRYKPF